MRAIAITKIDDLVGNHAELLEPLLAICIAAARQEYEHPTPRIGTTDRYD